MPDYENRGNRNEQWVPGEFVVVLRDLQLVQYLLNVRLGITFDEPNEVETSRPLGLARIRFADITDVVARIRARYDAGDRHPGPLTTQALTRPELPVELVLAFIRDEFGAEFGGWVPTIGKNRAVDGVHAAPYVSIGADEGYAEPVDHDVPISESKAGFGPGWQPWVDVGILDTGFSEHHDFGGRWRRCGPNPLLDAASRPWCHIAGHSTFIAGLILQRAPNAFLNVRQVLDASDGTASAWDVAEAMMDLARSVKVLNLSFCCYTADGEPPLVLRHAIERLDPATVVVAAAGNHGANPLPAPESDQPGPTATMWPAAFDRVYAVGAHDGAGVRAPFSPEVSWVRLSAPGVGITSTYLSGTVRFRYRPGDTGPATKEFPVPSATWSGTSFAAATVSGEIARLAGTDEWGAFYAVEEILTASRRWPDPTTGGPIMGGPRRDIYRWPY